MPESADGAFPDSVLKALPPFHLFKRMGHCFVFITSSCVFHEIDEVSYAFLEQNLQQANNSNLTKYLTRQDILKGISILERDGLFSDANYCISDKQIIKDANLFGSRSVYAIELAVAESCNLACTYCYCGNSRDLPENKLMSEQTAHQAVCWLFKNSQDTEKLHITFIGGEPLLNKIVIRSVVEYSQLLAKHHKKTVSYDMTTNATLLDDDFISFSKMHSIKIRISLDGPRKIHDAQCPTRSGNGSYMLATAGAKRMISKRRAFVRCTMTHPMRKLTELFEFFEDFGFSRSTLVPAINLSSSPSPVDFNDDDYGELARQEEELIPMILEKISKGEKLKYNPFGSAYSRIEKHNTAWRPKCKACHGGVLVDVNGAIYPCHRFGGMKEWVIGNIASGLNYDRCRRFWYEYRKCLSGSCETCWAWSICKGPCAWELASPDGTLSSPVRFCSYRKAKVESAACAYVLNKQNAGLKVGTLNME